MSERMTYTTVDGVKIVGDWVTAPTTLGAVILVHSMQTTRSSWAAVQAALAKRGLASVAIDLRGHGDSIVGPEGAGIDAKTFKSDAEHQSSLYDVIGAYEWLRDRGIAPSQMAVVGASIGANLAVEFLLEHPLVAAGALLSPGADYHGTNVVADAPSVLPDQSMWIAASEIDDQESFEASQKVYEEVTSDRKTFVPLKNAGHGTEMFNSHPELIETLADWLLAAIQHV